MRMTPEAVVAHQARVAASRKLIQAAPAPPVPAVFVPKPTKYRSVPTYVNGKRFDSKLEAEYYKKLHLRWVAGEVLWFLRQVPIEIEGGKYVVDFLYYTPGPPYAHFVDTSGFITPMKRQKLKQVKERWNIDVELVRKV